MKLTRLFTLASLISVCGLSVHPTFAQRYDRYDNRGSEMVLARARVVNDFRWPVNVYQLNRWSGWEWVGAVDGQSEASFRARPRQMLLVTSARGEILAQKPVSLEGTTVIVGREERRGPEVEETVTLKFRNKTDSKVTILRINRAGRTEPAKELSGGKDWDTESRLGWEWVVLNKKGKTVERFIARENRKIHIE